MIFLVQSKNKDIQLQTVTQDLKFSEMCILEFVPNIDEIMWKIREDGSLKVSLSDFQFTELPRVRNNGKFLFSYIVHQTRNFTEIEMKEK